MIELWKGRTAEAVLQSYLRAKEQEEKTRRDGAHDRLSIYHDDWKDLLDGILRTQFSSKNYGKLLLALDTSQNVLKNVVKEVSILYKKAPTRDTGENEILDEAYSYLNIDEFMMRVERYGFLLNDVLVRVGWDRDLKRVTLNLQTPADTSVIQRPDYPEQAGGIYYPVEYADDKFKTEKLNVYWDDFEHFLFDDKGNAKPPSEDNPEMKNPYGILPFIVLHMEQIPGMFWNPTGGSDMVDGTKLTGMKRTLKNHLFKWQSYKQPWVKAMNAKDIPEEMLTDPSAFWKLYGEGAGVGFLDLQADLKMLNDTIRDDMNAFLATYKLSADMFTSSPDEMSGRALIVKNRGLAEIRESHLPYFRNLEYSLAQMIVHVSEVANGKKLGVEPDGRVELPELDFSIDYAEMNTYTDPMEQRKQADHDVQKGIISPAQYYMQFNPDITDEAEAERAMTDNLAKYKEMQGKGFNLQSYFGGDEGQEGDNSDAE